MLKDITPQQLSSLSFEQKTELCAEIRNTIIETVKKTGGHLASNLGIVELTVELLSAFSVPKDKIIFDVGHQCYPYKLLTGRLDRFDTLRQRGGISGFPKRSESIFDCYDTGHAGNSVSAAIGLKKGMQLQGQEGEVVAVIGDGAFNNGLIYEALNSLTVMGVNVLIVLNDNDMSISPTVGSTHRLLQEKRKAERAKNIALLEQYGVKYYGKIDGNDLTQLNSSLKIAKAQLKNSSVLLHVQTVKGRGYNFCEENPTATHGVSPVNSDPTPEYSQIFGETLLSLAKNDQKITVMTAAMTDALGLRPFFNTYPERSFDVGICEENASVLCAGLAASGMKPYYAIYSTFLQRAFDEIVIDICAQDLPVTFVVDRGGVSGADGETHQGVFDLSYLSFIPNLVIASPKDGEELKELLRFSTTYPHPMAIRYPRSATAHFKESKIADFSWEYLLGNGSEKVTVLAVGERMLLKAFEIQKQTKLPFSIVNARFVKPIDEALLNQIISPVVITLEDGMLLGGFGEKIASYYSTSKKTVKSFGLEDKFIPHGSVDKLQDEFGLSNQEIARYIENCYADR